MKLAGAARQLVGAPGSEDVPAAYVTRIIKEGRLQARGSVRREDEMDYLLQYLS